MNTLFGLGALGTVLIVAVVALVALLIGLGMVRSWIKVARADEALVISGKSQKNSDGTTSATTVVVNGKAVVQTGQLVTVDEAEEAAAANACAGRYLGRAL